VPLTILVLLGLVVCLTGTAVVHSAGFAAGLLIFSAAWLPANNGQLEGPVLAQFSATHGITVADLLGLGGLALATVTLAALTWRTAPAVERIARTMIVVSLCGAALAVGAGLALASG
jgi:hypothetical protein